MLGKTVTFMLLLAALVGCQQFEPTQNEAIKYPEIDSLLTQQVGKIKKQLLEKRVWLSDESETQQFAVDSLLLARELIFLEEVNPNEPEYVGAFNEDRSLVHFELSLKEGEKGPLKFFRSEISANQTQSIKATIHEEKDIFTHHRDIKINFFKDVITDYEIRGYQKIIKRDTIPFRIVARFQD